MPISVEERDALRGLVQFTVDELTAAGDPDNNLNSLQALTENRMAEYQATLDLELQVVWALINADSTGQVHEYWGAALTGVFDRLNATAIDLIVLYRVEADPRVRKLGKGLPLLASLRWTITNFQTG